MKLQQGVLTTGTVLALTALIFTGCTGSSASSQSTKQACKVLETDLQSAATSLTSAFDQMQSDPEGAETALAKFDTQLKASTAKVTNTKVKTAANATIKAVDSLDSGLKAYITDSSNTTQLESGAKDVQTTFTKLGSICT